jgi:hypothetical protein
MAVDDPSKLDGATPQRRPFATRAQIIALIFGLAVAALACLLAWKYGFGH